MNSFKTLNNLLGWIVFGVAMVVYAMSAETSGSLWDCGEFVAGAKLLQVVHPPGAPLFLLIGRVAIMIGEIFSDDPSIAAFSVNILSGICSALCAAFVCWSAIILGKLAILGRDEEPDMMRYIGIGAGGVIAGLSTAFATSIWFSAVEGEVYAMSTMFTAMTLWAMLKWYNLPDTPNADRWILFAVYSAGLSIGVHLLSLLTFPALAMFYYFKKYQNHTWKGIITAGIVGVGLIVAIQGVVITGIPKLWGMLEILCVNTLGLPFNVSLVPLLLIIGGAFFYGFRSAERRKNGQLQRLLLILSLSIISFSTIGVVLLRAAANTPINMNNPSDPIRLIPYLNREQYGERPLLYGPQFNAQPVRSETTDRYGRVGDRYEVTDKKIDYVFSGRDKVLFPRMGHYEGEKKRYYLSWMGIDDQRALQDPMYLKNMNRPNFVDNYSYFFRYQIGWMYWRYFMWNFSGRQNSQQGIAPWDKSSGNWISGIGFIDNTRLYDQSIMTDRMKNDPSRNRYYMIPFLLGLLGMWYHYKQRSNDFLGLFAMFIITGIGIIVYSNQPPIEPRERDYVLAGSIFTYCIWIGIGVMAIAELLRSKIGNAAGPAALAIGAVAPFLMLTQNFDDHSRSGHVAARDYASNFLNSCDSNAIVFTYGDNDTYPLWYAQEVEGIRTDVRVVNLSLIAVDWYIDQLRRKINNSPAIKMGLTAESMRGYKRNQVIVTGDTSSAPISLTSALKFVGEDHPFTPPGYSHTFESSVPSPNLFIDIDREKVIANKVVSPELADQIVPRIDFRINDNSLIKDDLAILDIINSNINERPVYFAVTCRPDKLMNLDEYMQLEGLALRVVPVRTISPPSRFSIIGNGRIAPDKMFNNVTKRWKWGNFNAEDTYINPSYQPSIQSMRLSIARGAEEMLFAKDTTRAVALVDKYFEGFPNNNFQYDGQTMILINTYVRANAKEKAKKHLTILANETANQLLFLTKLPTDLLQTSFGNDYSMAERTKTMLLEAANQLGDEAFKAQLEKQLTPFKSLQGGGN